MSLSLKPGKPVPGWCFQYVDQKYSMGIGAQLDLMGELFDQGNIPIKDPTLKDIKFLKEQLNEGPLINPDCEICGLVWYHCKCEKMTLREEFENEVKTGKSNLEILFETNAQNYIDWLEKRIKGEEKAPVSDRIPDELIEEIINKYGPEGCYEMAEKLIAAANKDISNALSE